MNSDPKKLQLRPVEVPGLPPLLEIPPGGLSLGRDPASGAPLDGLLYPQVSLHHARVFAEGRELIVEDLRSSNGLTLNGAPVERATIRPGDILQLGGPGGPRFIVVGESPLLKTVRVPAPMPRSITSELGQEENLGRIKTALGIPPEASGVNEMVRRPVRLLAAVLVLISVLLVAGGWSIVRHFGDLQRREEGARTKLAELEERNRALQRRIDAAGGDLEAERRRWEEEKGRLESERARDLAKIDSLEKGQSSAREKDLSTNREIEEVRKSLQETTRRLERYDPVNLEQEKEARRRILEKAVGAVVFIEQRVRFREKTSGKFLSFGPGEDGAETPHLDGKGEAASLTKSGSGFCISAEGWILTNAHVVKEPQIDGLELLGAGLELQSELRVVFSGRPERRTAELRAKIEDGDDDMALLKIEPFEGIPVIGELDLAERALPPGVEVRLFGFPLGRNILQGEGEKLAASVFRGIVSRTVESYFQIQAAVYPGNSGGPVLDENGRVLGVVTAVQRTTTGQIASDIGYVIPIARAKRIWPPPKGTP